MKQITMYEAIDGSKFSNQFQALLYENLITNLDTELFLNDINLEINDDTIIINQFGVLNNPYIDDMTTSLLNQQNNKSENYACTILIESDYDSSYMLSDDLLEKLTQKNILIDRQSDYIKFSLDVYSYKQLISSLNELKELFS